MKTTNKRLKDLYSSKYPDLTTELNNANSKLEPSEKATNPLLIQVDEKYINADIKIMFFGQETNTWLGELNDGAFLGKIEPMLDLYEDFFIEGSCFAYGGQFWNGINRLKKLTTEKIPNKKISYIWNNIIKIGKCGMGFPSETNALTNKYFNVILQEIEILEPDVIIFFSGPNYDEHIEKVIGKFYKVNMPFFIKRQLCKIASMEFELAFRTYHPNYLWRNNIDKFLSPIINEIAEYYS